jgi:hypothetical protein
MGRGGAAQGGGPNGGDQIGVVHQDGEAVAVGAGHGGRSLNGSYRPDSMQSGFS